MDCLLCPPFVQKLIFLILFLLFFLIKLIRIETSSSVFIKVQFIYYQLKLKIAVLHVLKTINYRLTGDQTLDDEFGLRNSDPVGRYSIRTILGRF